MSSMSWFRCYSELSRDRKIIMAAKAAGVTKTEMLGAWVTLLCLANDSPTRGKLLVTFQERFTVTDIETELETDAKTTEKILSALIRYEMLERDKDGVYCVKNWEKRQFQSDNSTERVKKHRDKINETLHERFGNAPDTDTDTDTETDNTTTGVSEPSPADVAALSRAYESNIGMIGAMMVDTLTADLTQYGLQNCLDAIQEAVKNNHQKWSYVQGILKNWGVNGRGRSPKAAPTGRRSMLTGF